MLEKVIENDINSISTKFPECATKTLEYDKDLAVLYRFFSSMYMTSSPRVSSSISSETHEATKKLADLVLEKSVKNLQQLNSSLHNLRDSNAEKDVEDDIDI